jgi:serine-type D-Ala-D-Ala carboxypeptidase (penicillin-binding protein 5/6)
VSHTLRRRAVAGVLLCVIVGLPAAMAATPSVHGPPPTPVPPHGSLSPFPQVLRTPADTTNTPTVDARSALLADLDSGRVLFQKNEDEPVPIASLTKIMTALVVLERSKLTDHVRIDPRAVFDRKAYGAATTLGLRAGERVTVEDLLYGLLLGSANDAAIALAIHVAGSEDAFVSLLNRRAARLGMDRTHLDSASGLDDHGHSTPADLLRLVRAAYRQPAFAEFTSTRFHTIDPAKGPKRTVQNRNALLWLYPGAFGTKTGSTAAAGNCLVAAARRDGRRLVAIVLHAPDEAFSDAASLLNYGFEGFTRRTLVRAGAEEGSLRIRGGIVPVVAGRSLNALVPTASLDDVGSVVVGDPTAAFPPAPGERIGTLKLGTPGLPLGSVPLVVSSVPPPPATSGPWWARSFAAVGRAIEAGARALAR